MNKLAVVLLASLALNPTLLGQDQSSIRTPRWLRDYKFESADFTFVRIKYDNAALGRRRIGTWATDYPDADIALSKHLAEVTSLRVNPDGKVLRLTDDDLSDYPFIYLAEPGQLLFSQEEVEALRRYLLEGGFLMVDDFWGEAERTSFLGQIKRVFPAKEPEDVPLEHPIFHCVYDLKEKPQVPSIATYFAGKRTERADAPSANFMAFYDNNRMMVFICHNTDLADGWERMALGGDYAREHSLKRAIPMGTNVVFYALTQRP